MRPRNISGHKEVMMVSSHPKTRGSTTHSREHIQFVLSNLKSYFGRISMTDRCQLKAYLMSY